MLAMLVPALASAYTTGDAKKPPVDDSADRPRVQVIVNDAPPAKRTRARLVYVGSATPRDDARAQRGDCMLHTGSRLNRSDREGQRCTAGNGQVFVPIR
jgi:hypothetical protein